MESQIKFLERLKPGTINSVQVKDFRSEIEVMKNIKPHPNILQLYGVCEESTDKWYAIPI